MAPRHHAQDDGPPMVRVPAEVERPDPIIFGLSARQAALAASVLGSLWALWQATRTWLPAPVFLAAAGPIATAAITVLTVRKHGRGLEEVLLDWWRHHRGAKRLVPTDGLSGEGAAPVPEWIDVSDQPLPAPLRLPATAISEAGIVDLGNHGLARPVASSTVNFGLRTPAEQRALLAGFARWLHSLATPVQVVARAERLDLTPVIHRLTSQANGLPHPALERACRSYAAFLEHLAATRHPLRRRVTLVLTADGGQDSELAHRAEDTARALGGCDLAITPLSGPQATGLLRAAADPQHARARSVGSAAAVIHGDPAFLDTHAESDADQRSASHPERS